MAVAEHNQNTGLTVRWVHAGVESSCRPTPAHHESCDSKVANKIHFVHVILITSGVVASDSILELFLTLQTFSWDVCTERVAETTKAAVVSRACCITQQHRRVPDIHLLEWWSSLSSTFFVPCWDVQGSHRYEKLLSLGNGYSESYNR